MIHRFASILVLLLVSPVFATDHFLTFGGGDAPSRNQVSLEKNVQYLQRVLKELGVPAEQQDVFFSDGNDPGRDLQAHVATEIPKINVLLSRILTRNEDLIGLEYRNAQIEHVRGPSNRKSITDWFAREGSKLQAGDRLLIYFTGHGGAGAGGGGGPGSRRGPSPQQARNTTLTMWREDSMTVKEFTGLLDKLPPKVQVVLVMVQCHAGGFADVIFKNADAGSSIASLSDRNRCGFFATVPERPAAGCTPDIDEENYHEYSTYFWEALSGRTRLGSTIKKPDYDGDGKVSFAEAHAYVKLTSSTIDIPICTSDVFLRSFSRTSGPIVVDLNSPPAPKRGQLPGNQPRLPAPPDNTAPRGNGDAAPIPANRSDRLLTADSQYYTLLESADPARKAVLEGLSEQLKFSGPERARAARDLANQLQRQKDDLNGQQRSARRSMSEAREKIATMLRSRWPELSTAFHPKQQELLQKESDTIVKAIESHEAYKQMESQRTLYEKIDDRLMELDRQWVKTQRFLRTLEDVALAANLPKVASREVVERYERLLKAEYGGI